MSTLKKYKSPAYLARRIRTLQKTRRQTRINLSGKISRKRHTPAQKREILMKTNKRCHICGGKIASNEAWEADHIHTHSMGGTHSVDNYLPAHKVCNNTRWHYLPEEVQWIMKMGVWLRTEIQNDTEVGQKALESIWKQENRNSTRRK